MFAIVSSARVLAIRTVAFLALGFWAMSCVFLSGQADAQASVFHVIHPDVEKGQIEIEILNGFDLGSTEPGEERSVHEIAIGLGITDYWKLTGAFEIANPQGDSAEIEAFEIENVFILPFGGHGHGGSHDDGKDGHDEEHGFTLGLFVGFEIPTDGGLSEGGMEIGPVIETEIGPAEFIGNLFVEVPFVSGEDPGLSYASQLVFPVNEQVGIGVENYGAWEGLFGERAEDVHFMGPALYLDLDLANGHRFEPRLAVLFGLNDDAPDAVLSFNIEYKFGGE